MSLVIPDIAARRLLDALIENLDPWIHLFTADVAPGPRTLLADLTEASFVGYSPLHAKYWTDARTYAGRAVSWSDPLLWTCSADGPLQTVHGYYVTNGPAGVLLWAERRPAGGVPVEHLGDQVAVNPRFSFRTDPDPG